MRNLLKVAIFVSIMAVAGSANALYSTVDTADLIKNGTYQIGLEPQYIMDGFPGGNVIAHFDYGSSDNSNFRFVLGSGSTNFQAGGFFKIDPIPDYQDQPGLGGFFGILYAVENGNPLIAFRVHPIISKKFVSESSGEFTPYASIPFGITFYSSNTLYPVQVALGTRWLPPGVHHVNFFGELGLNINSAFSYISLGMTVPFDSWDTLKLD